MWSASNLTGFQLMVLYEHFHTLFIPQHDCDITTYSKRESVFYTVLWCDMICNFKKQEFQLCKLILPYPLCLCLSFYMQCNTNLVYYHKHIYNLDAFYSLKPTLSENYMIVAYMWMYKDCQTDGGRGFS